MLRSIARLSLSASTPPSHITLTVCARTATMPRAAQS